MLPSIISFHLAEVPATASPTLPSKFGSFAFVLPHCFCGFACQPPAAIDRLTPSCLSCFPVLPPRHPTLLFLTSENWFYFPYLSFFAKPEELSSCRKLQKTHKGFDMLVLSTIWENGTALISSLTLTNKSPLSAQFIVICLINSSKHWE